MDDRQNIVVVANKTEGFCLENIAAAYIAAANFYFQSAQLAKVSLLIDKKISAYLKSLSEQNIQVPITLSPLFRNVLVLMGVDEKSFLRETDGQYLLGTYIHKVNQKENLQSEGHVQTFGETGTASGAVDFHQLYQRCQNDGARNLRPIYEYSLAAKAALCQKFEHPDANPNSILSTIYYGYTVDLLKLIAFVGRLLSSKISIHVFDVLEENIDRNDRVFEVVLDKCQTLPVDLYANFETGSMPTGSERSLGDNFQSVRRALFCFDYVDVDCEKVCLGAQALQSKLLCSKIFFDWGWIDVTRYSQHVFVKAFVEQCDGSVTEKIESDIQRYLSRYYKGLKIINSPELSNLQLDLTMPINTSSLDEDKFVDWSGNVIKFKSGCQAFPMLNMSWVDYSWLMLDALCNYIYTACKDEVAANLLRVSFNDTSKSFSDKLKLNGCLIKSYDRWLVDSPKNDALSEQSYDSNGKTIEAQAFDRFSLFKRRGKIIRDSADIFPESYYAILLYGLGVKLDIYHPLADHQRLEDFNDLLVSMERAIDGALKGMPDYEQFMMSYLGAAK